MLKFDSIGRNGESFHSNMAQSAKACPMRKSLQSNLHIDSCLYRSTDFDTTSSCTSQPHHRRGSSITSVFVTTPPSEMASLGNPFTQKEVHDMYLNLLTIQQDNSKDCFKKFDSHNMLDFSSAKKDKADRNSDIGSHLVMESVREKASES